MEEKMSRIQKKTPKVNSVSFYNLMLAVSYFSFGLLYSWLILVFIIFIIWKITKEIKKETNEKAHGGCRTTGPKVAEFLDR